MDRLLIVLGEGHNSVLKPMIERTICDFSFLDSFFGFLLSKLC